MNPAVEPGVPNRWVRPTRLLALVLSLLPLGVAWVVDALPEDPGGETARAWLERTRPAANRMREASDPAFWAEWLARRIRRAWQVPLPASGKERPAPVPAGVPDRRPSLPLLPPRPLPAEATLSGLPRPLVWGVEFPVGPLTERTTGGTRRPPGRPGGGSGVVSVGPVAMRETGVSRRHPWRQRGSPSDILSVGTVGQGVRLATGDGWCTADRFLITRLFLEMARARRLRVSPLASQVWDQRLEYLFGFSITGDLFAPEFRGQAIPVIHRGRYAMMVWDLWPARGRPRRGLLLVLPLPRSAEALGRRAIIRHWRSRRQFPAFLSFPTDFGGARVRRLTHPVLQHDPHARQILGEIQQEMRLSPSPAPGREAMGEIRLPVSLSGRMLAAGPWRARLVPLAWDAGALGVLFERQLPPPPDPLRQGAFLWGLWCVAGWVLILGRAWWFGTPPAPRLETVLLGWFLGLVFVPLVVGSGKGAAFLAGREANLQAARFRHLEAVLGDLEQEHGRLTIRHEASCRALLQDPGLAAGLQEIRLGRHPAEPLLDALWRKAQLAGIPLQLLVVFGTDGFFLHRRNPDFAVDRRGFFTDLLIQLWGAQFWQSVPAAPRPPPPPGLTLPPQTSLGFSMTNPRSTFQTRYNRTETLWLGAARPLGYRVRIHIDQEPWFVAGMVWEQDVAFQEAVRHRLVRVPADEGIRGRAVFRRLGRNLLLVGASQSLEREEAGLWRQAARRGQDDEARWAAGDSLWLARPLQEMPDFVLVARGERRDIAAALGQERRWIGLAMLATLALVVLTAREIGQRIAAPLHHMTEALRLVAAGDLGAGFPVERPDEIGSAGRSLEAMSRSLRERQSLIRFVSPRVMEAVAEGNPQRLAIGRTGVAAVLASDLREFTTLSERHPPEAVFTLLNRHLAAMTRAVHTHGGFVDRFIGDAILAVFPERGDRPAAARALDAAGAMRRAHLDLVRERLAAGTFPYRIGIGIDVGSTVAGVLGDPEVRLDYTVLGEPVRRAVNLETRSKQGQASRVVLSGAARQQCGVPAAAFRPLPGPEEAWEWLGDGSFPADAERIEPPLTWPGMPLSQHPDHAVPPASPAQRPSRESPGGPPPAGDPLPAQPRPDGRLAAQPRPDDRLPARRRTTDGVAGEPRSGGGVLEDGTGEGLPAIPDGKPECFGVPSPAPGAGTGQGILHDGPGSRLAAFIWWVLPACVLLVPWWGWWQDSREAATAEVSERLDRHHDLVVKLLAPLPQASWALRRLWASHSPKAEDGPSPTPAIPTAFLETVTRAFPDMGWAWLGFTPPATSTTARFETLSLEPPPPGFPGVPAADLDIGPPLSPGLTRWDPPARPTPDGSSPAGLPALTLRAGEGDVHGRGDRCRFIGWPLPDPATLTVHVASLTRSHPFAKAGVMVRAETASQGAMLFLYRIADGGIRVDLRPRPGEEAAHSETFPVGNPAWLRLGRQGSHFQGWASDDGTAWRFLASGNLNLGDQLLVGLAASAHLPGLEDGGWPNLIATGGRAFPLASPTWSSMPSIPGEVLGLLGLATRVTLLQATGLDPHLATLSFDRFKAPVPLLLGGEQYWSRFLDSTCGTLEDRIVASASVVTAWFPAFDPRQPIPEQTDDLASAGGNPWSRFTWEQRGRVLQGWNQAITGALFLFFDPQTLTGEQTAPLFISALASEGVQVALGFGHPRRSFATPLYRHDPSLRQALAEPFVGERRFGPWLVRKAVVFHGERYALCLAIPLPPSRDLPPAGGCLLILALGWLAIGVWPLLATPPWRQWAAHRLQRQLTGAFLVALIPPLGLALLLGERSGVTSSTGDRDTARWSLVGTLRALDEGINLYHGWALNLLRHHSRQHPGLREDLLGTPGGPAPPILDELRGLRRQLTARGLLPRSLSLFAPGRRQGHFPATSQGERLEAFGRVQEQFFRRCSGRLSRFQDPGKGGPVGSLADHDPGGSRPHPGRPGDTADHGSVRTSAAGVELLFGSEMDSFKRDVGLMLGPTRLARMFLSPWYLGNWMAGEQSWTAFFRATLWGPAGPRSEFQCGYVSPHYEYQLWRSAQALPPSLTSPGLRWGVSERTRPLHRLIPPYMVQEDTGSDLPPSEFPCQTLNLPAWTELGQRARSSREGELTVVGTGPDTRLAAAWPARHLGRWTLYGDLSLARLTAAREEDQTRRRWFLLGLLGLAIILAGSVAGDFLEPIARLSETARRVTKGDFQRGLPVTGTGEFQDLARHFNAILQGVREGRLLGRFVSDSVLALARGPTLANRSRTGVREEAVVLFASLGGSHRQAARDQGPTDTTSEVDRGRQVGGWPPRAFSADPTRLISMLNGFLAAMSRCIRQEDGEIDKFIGDKVLAVFRRGAGEAREAAMGRALRASRAMRQAAVGIAADWPVALGVGVVEGPVLAGVLGTEEIRLECTVIGDTVNLASRLADLASSHPGGGVLTAGPAPSAEVAPGFGPPQRLAVRTIKGKSREVEIFLLPDRTG